MAEAVHLTWVAAVIAGAVMLVMAALHDVVARTVPNQLAAAIACAGLVGQCAALAASLGNALSTGGSLADGFFRAGMAMLASAGVFVAAALAWRRGWMGGGDVKLLGAASSLMPAVLVPTLLMATSLAGGVLALVYLVARRRLARPGSGRATGLLARAVKAERWRLRRGGPLPYAVAIASGAVFVFSRLMTQGGMLP
jgi:prepilin peptidase CpaA